MSILSAVKDKLRGAKRSLTVWFNAAMGAALLVLPDAVSYAVSNLPQIQPYMPDNLYKWLMAVAVVGNFLLRFKTSLPLEHK